MLRVDGRIGRYEITRRVAHGGMGSLYLAHDPVLDRTVALKLFHRDLDLPDAREGFVREARSVAALSHPNIVTIYDYGEYASQPYLVMEYIEGQTLADLVRRKAGVADVVKVRWLEELCAAVAYAHERGIIHRDIKPANLMIDGYGRLHVLDFGIARMRGTLASSETASIGTPGYMAPEQLRSGAVDHRSDLFSIGVVGYTLFAEAEPFVGETPQAVSLSVLESDPRPLQEVRPSIDPDLARIIAHALQKQADRRVQTAEAFRAAVSAVRRRLEATASDTIVAYAPPPPATPAGLESTVIAAPPPGLAPADVAAPTGPIQRTTRSTGRQREALVQGWIQLAREHHAHGEMAEARDACLQAIGLDPERPAALELLATIDAAMAPAAPRSPVDDATVLVQRPPIASAAPSDATVLIPVSRIPSPPVPPPPEARVTVPEAVAADRPAVRSTSRPVAGRPRALPALALDQRTLLIAAAVAVALVLAFAGWWMSSGPAAPEPVRVVIDATPWATVTGIVSANGEALAVPEPAATPLPVWLAPGTYRVSLLGPDLDARELTIEVDGGTTRSAPLARFPTMTADEYFRSITGDLPQALDTVEQEAARP